MCCRYCCCCDNCCWCSRYCYRGCRNYCWYIAAAGEQVEVVGDVIASSNDVVIVVADVAVRVVVVVVVAGIAVQFQYSCTGLQLFSLVFSLLCLVSNLFYPISFHSNFNISYRISDNGCYRCWEVWRSAQQMATFGYSG